MSWVEDLCSKVVGEVAQESAVVVLDGVLQIVGPVHVRILFLLGYGFAVEEEVRAGAEVQTRRIGENGLFRHLEDTSFSQEKIGRDGRRDRPW